MMNILDEWIMDQLFSWKKNSGYEFYLWLDFFKRVRKVAVLLYALGSQINIYTLSYANAVLSIC